VLVSLNFEFFGVFGFKKHPVWFNHEEITFSRFTKFFKSNGVSAGAPESGAAGI
jgi:hypothetical protein